MGLKKFMTLCLFVLLVNLTIYSQANKNKEDYAGELKKVSRFKFSYLERFRFVGWDNAISLDADDPQNYSFTRLRSNFSVLWDLTDDLDIFLKISNENRVFLSPAGDFNLHEIFFDNLYVKWKNPGNIPVQLTIGRQNIMLGEGFVVLDGHPLDGSRSNYFNAFRVDYELNKIHKFTGFLTYVPEKDNILPVINDRDQPLLEQPEWGLGIYYTGRFKAFDMDAYFIRKTVTGTDAFPEESGISTFGARLRVPILDDLSLTLEAAYQGGSLGTVSRRSFGGYFHADYILTSLPVIEKVMVGGFYLGGDDPETENWEGWDPLFSRWPKWSESYIYTLIKEYNGKVAYWSNISSLYAAVNFLITDKVNFDLTCHILKAIKLNPNSAFTSGGGTNRGLLAIGKLNFRMTENLSGHFLWEHFSPGDYYFAGADSYNWLRFEFIFKI